MAVRGIVVTCVCGAVLNAEHEFITPPHYHGGVHPSEAIHGVQVERVSTGGTFEVTIFRPVLPTLSSRAKP